MGLLAAYAAPFDSYTQLIKHMAAEQRQKRAEEDFAPLAPSDLAALLTEGPPSNVADLKSLVLEELSIAHKILIGDELDQVRDFWDDAGIPRDENRCRDRLAAIIAPELRRYAVHPITEADMVYQAARADAAAAALRAFADSEWGQKFPTVAAMWQRQWAQVIPFFAYPPPRAKNHLYDQRHREHAHAAAQDRQEPRPFPDR